MKGVRVPKRERKRTEKKKKGLCCKGQEGGKTRRVRSKNLSPFSAKPPPPSFFGLLGDKSSPPTRYYTAIYVVVFNARGRGTRRSSMCRVYTVYGQRLLCIFAQE